MEQQPHESRNIRLSGTTRRCSPPTASWQEIRTYYKFRGRGRGAATCCPASTARWTLSGRVTLLRGPARAGGWLNRAPEPTTHVRACGGGPGENRISPGGPARVLIQGHSPGVVTGGIAQINRPEIYTVRSVTSTSFRGARARGRWTTPRRPERLHSLRGSGRHPDQFVRAQGGLRGRASAR